MNATSTSVHSLTNESHSYQNHTSPNDSVTPIYEHSTPEDGADKRDILIGDEVLVYTILYIYILGVLSLFGIVTNLINIAVYIRIGISVSTVNLFSLAVVDFSCMLLQLWISVSLAFGIFVDQSDVSFDPWNIYTVTGYRPKIVLTQIACFATAFLAFERCVRVFLLFGVKGNISTKYSVFAIIIIVVVSLVTCVPIYTVEHLVWLEGRLESQVSSLVTMETYHVAVVINCFILRLCTILITVVCNFAVYRIMSSNSWALAFRPSTSIEVSNSFKTTAFTLAEADGVSWDTHWQYRNGFNKTPTKRNLNMERKLIRVTTVISIIFVICYTPQIILVLMTEISNIFPGQTACATTLLGFQFLVEVINSNIKIFVYIFMNSRYRNALRALLRLDRIKIIVV